MGKDNEGLILFVALPFPLGGSLSLAAELGFATAASGEDAGLALGLASDTGSTLAVTHALDAKVEFWSTCGGSDSWVDAGTPPPASPCDSTTDTDLCPDDGLVNGCISGIPVCDTPSGDNDLDLCDGVVRARVCVGAGCMGVI